MTLPKWHLGSAKGHSKRSREQGSLLSESVSERVLPCLWRSQRISPSCRLWQNVPLKRHRALGLDQAGMSRLSGWGLHVLPMLKFLQRLWFASHSPEACTLVWDCKSPLGASAFKAQALGSEHTSGMFAACEQARFILRGLVKNVDLCFSSWLLSLLALATC